MKMAASSELRRLAPWITVILIAFNAGWIASNIFESNYSYYQCLRMPDPMRNQDIIRETFTPPEKSTIKTTTTKITIPSTKTETSKPTTTTKLVTTVKSTSTTVKATQNVIDHKVGFNLWDYVNAPVPIDPGDQKFECLTGSADGFHGSRIEFPLCIFNPSIDIYVSGAIKSGGGRVWEVDNVRRIMDQLGEPRPEMGFLDIGANLGVFTLTAATAGHNVVAVEPMAQALRRLRKSIDMGKINDRVKVVQAALSNDTGQLFLNIDKKNKGGSFLVPREKCGSAHDFSHRCDTNNPVPIVFMDDLLSVIKFKNAIMKIDCEGFEYRAFKRSSRLLDEVNITYIMMEFMHYTKWWNYPRKKREIDIFVNYLGGKGYQPRSTGGIPLDKNHWHNWPSDITWVKKQQEDNKNPTESQNYAYK